MPIRRISPSADSSPGTGASERSLLLALAAFVVLAAPLALYSWHVLSELLAGRSELRSLLIASGCGALFAALAAGFGSWVSRMEDEAR